MKVEVTIQLLRFCSHVFNSIFLVLGLSVAGCGVWILFSSESFLTILPSDPGREALRTVGVGLLAIGGVVVLVSVIGCLAADGGKRFLLLVYLGFLVVLVLGQLFVTLLLLINRDQIEQSLDQTVDHIIRDYGATSEDGLMDGLQNSGQCCGRTGPADWLNNRYIQSLNLTNPDVLPCSCFRQYRPVFNSSWCSELLDVTVPQYGRGNSSYDQGCKKKLSDWLQENTLTIIGMDVGLMLIQVLQFIVSVYLYRAFGRKAALKRSGPVADSDHAHLDHTPEDDLYDGEQNCGYIDPDDDYIDSTHSDHYHDYQNYGDPTHLVYHNDNQNPH
ncbi:CD82 antigen [Chelmon rostratus]|uniref:CD82 antigen n=1 Tax=Chelmon rostratus TaxID=109905 RepID=UPI001BE8E267|nr:CD82 antigen [Chelmon rostratus]XP_041799030.1 CD82 antigen [Chelmon rostratus]XP_041799031.1 CD82 antigen [Chelmon rostratus]XP_041799032.1 CD82 antigen [Chelmon rostratus]